jgi:hypothetical protein
MIEKELADLPSFDLSILGINGLASVRHSSWPLSRGWRSLHDCRLLYFHMFSAKKMPIGLGTWI